MAEKKQSGKTVTVEQIRSSIRCSPDQRATLTGLGLNKMNRRRALPDTLETHGMIGKIPHMVRIVEDQA